MDMAKPTFYRTDILQEDDLKKLRFLYGSYGSVLRVLFNTVGLGREDSKEDWLTSLDHYERLVRAGTHISYHDNRTHRRKMMECDHDRAVLRPEAGGVCLRYL